MSSRVSMSTLCAAVLLDVTLCDSATTSTTPAAATNCSSVVDTILGFGHNLARTTANDAGGCCSKCRANPKCLSWTFHSTGSAAHTCYLHQAVGPSSHVKGVVSGVPHGAVPKGPVPPPVPPSPRTCVPDFLGCFKEIVPAPGVPPIRALPHQVGRPSKVLTLASCARECGAQGYPFAGLDRNKEGLTSCYCGCGLNKAAPTVPHATNISCTQEIDAMEAYHMPCANSTTCGGGPAKLPAGRACSQAAAKAWRFCDTSLSLDERVTDLVDRITLEEAGPLLTARQSPEIPRLGIPAFYWGTNAIHGIDHGNATSFPQALNLGCTFNKTAARAVGRQIGREMRAFQNVGVHPMGLTSWSPTINIIRDCRWGRNQETISEDPVVAGEYGKQWSLGMQYDRDSGDNRPPPKEPSASELMAVATIKHVLGCVLLHLYRPVCLHVAPAFDTTVDGLVVDSLEQWSPDGNWSEDVYDRINFDAVINPQDLEETYTQGFKRAIAEGGAGGIMYSCNMVNHIPAPASSYLRDKLSSWGFTGCKSANTAIVDRLVQRYRTTDGDGINGMNDPHRQNYTDSILDSIRIAMVDGENDIDDGGSFGAHLVEAVEANRGLNMTVVRRALFNTFRMRFRLGQFDPAEGQKYLKLGMEQVDNLAAQQLNTETSRQSMVLLQNHNETLPFTVSSGKVVVIGGSANSTRLLGGGHYARSLNHVDGFETGGFPGIPQAIEAVLESRRQHETRSDAETKYNRRSEVEYYPGIACTARADSICSDPAGDSELQAAAVAAASKAAQVVIVLNLQGVAPCDNARAVERGGEFNPCGFEGEQHDRPQITLPKHQEALALAVLDATSAARVPAVVVLVHGGALAIERIKAAAPAILDAHYPGEVTGAMAIAEALYGVYSPAGKLSYTVMPKEFDNLSDFSKMDMAAPPGRTYKYYPTSPDMPPALWEFGYGQTYTKFNISIEGISSSVLQANTFRAHGSKTYTVRLANIGNMDSDEVCFLFMIPPRRPNVPTPKKQLLDFERVHNVAKGSTTTVRFEVQSEQLDLVSVDGVRAPHKGTYTLLFTNGVDAHASVDVVVE